MKVYPAQISKHNLNCENQIILLIFQTLLIFQKYSKLKYQNLNSFSHLLLLLSGNISLNPGPVHQDTLQCSNEWNVFKNRGLHFINLNINSLLYKSKNFVISQNLLMLPS